MDRLILFFLGIFVMVGGWHKGVEWRIFGCLLMIAGILDYMVDEIIDYIKFMKNKKGGSSDNKT